MFNFDRKQPAGRALSRALMPAMRPTSPRRALLLPLLLAAGMSGRHLAAGAQTAGGQSVGAQPLGMLQGHGDVGTVLHAGSARFDPASDVYSVTGSGYNLWFDKDEMQFAWKRMEGDVSMTAAIDFAGMGGDRHRKAALMIRQSLDPGSAYADVARHGDGLTSLQFRLATGEITHEIETAATAPRFVQIVRRGETIAVFVGDSAQSMHYSGASIRLPLAGAFYVGLAVCSHDKDVSETALFRNLRIDAPQSGTGKRWSTVETVKAASTDRRVAFTTAANVTDARWPAADDAVTFRQGGQVERFALDPAPYPSLSVAEAYTAQQPRPVAAAAAASPSANGWVYTSGGAPGLWKMHADGSGRTQVVADGTDLAPSVSPDGKWLAYLRFAGAAPGEGELRQGEVRLLSLEDGTARTLATLLAGAQSLAAPAWSPDSTRVVFVSYAQVP